MKYIWTAAVIVGTTWGVNASEIKAIVGDMPISGYDVSERVRLMKLQQPSQTQNVNQNDLKQRALQVLVDEYIKRQEAEKQGFVVSDTEVKEAISRLEQQNNMSAGYMAELLKQDDIRLETLHNQVRSDLLWMQVINKHKNALKAITDKEIQNKKISLKKELAKPMYLLAEIVVPTKQEAEKIITDIRRGRVFSEVAAQKSRSLSAKENGLLGWVKADVYAPHIMRVVDKLNLNEMTAPLAVDNGWLIVLLLDKQEGAQNGEMPIWDLAQLATAKNKTVGYIPTVFKMTTCDEFVDFGNKKAIKETVRRGMTDPNQLPPQLKYSLKTQKVGTPIGPIQTEEGDLFFMKCGETTQSVLPSDDMIKSALEIEKMDELSEKLLRQVKRYVVVEYK